MNIVITTTASTRALFSDKINLQMFQNGVWLCGADGSRWSPIAIIHILMEQSTMEPKVLLLCCSSQLIFSARIQGQSYYSQRTNQESVEARNFTKWSVMEPLSQSGVEMECSNSTSVLHFETLAIFIYKWETEKCAATAVRVPQSGQRVRLRHLTSWSSFAMQQ